MIPLSYAMIKIAFSASSKKATHRLPEVPLKSELKSLAD